MVTGFELDNQRIAIKQVEALQQLVKVLKDITEELRELNKKP